MAAFLRRSWGWAAGGAALAFAALAFAALAGISLIGLMPANAAVNPELRHSLHLLHLEHAAHARALRARAWEVEIPSIGLTTDLATLGDPDGPTLAVPPLSRAATEAAWYRFTSVPGSVGNSVIVGHVDTYVGPAVFYNLYRLLPGDLIYVADGTGTERFAVRWVREIPKAEFPVNQVFGNTGKHQLWLITCGGAFDYQTGHYLDNIIVSALWRPTVKHRTKHPVKHHSKHVGKTRLKQVRKTRLKSARETRVKRRATHR